MTEISETKTPKPGEWWVSDRGVIAYVVGLTLNGDPAWQQKGSRLCLSDKMKFFLSCFHHEPRCTGFDWVEPVESSKTIMDCPDCGEFRGHGHVCRPASLDPDDMPLNPVPGTVVATGTVKLTPVTPNISAIIAEHTQQVRELTQRIGDLVQQVNERDAVIEGIRTALHVDYSV